MARLATEAETGVAAERCDAERLSAYLEASNQHNARLYARLGFERRYEVEGLDGVKVQPMWRGPR